MVVAEVEGGEGGEGEPGKKDGEEVLRLGQSVQSC